MLRYLLNFWFMAIIGMTFAAGSVIDAGAAGGGYTGSGDGGADTGAGGDGTGDGATDDGTGAIEVSEEEALAESGGAEDVGSNDQSNARGLDTKGFTAEDKKLLTLAQKAGPKEAQRVRQLLFAEKRLQKVVPGGVKAVAELGRSVEEF